MKVIAFNGSPRKNGNTSLLIKTVLEEIEKGGIETETMQIGGKKINSCRACYKCFENKDGKCVMKDDAVNEYVALMSAADGIIIGTPTYFADVSSETKAFIDRTGFVSKANGGLLNRKTGAAVVAVRRTGALHAFDTINHFFLISGMIVPGSTYWNIGYGREPGEVGQDEEGIETMHELGRNFAWLLKKTHE
jgi:multimeric flavodoxin WrbA